MRPLGAGLRRTVLTEGAWIDHRPGWLEGSAQVLDVLLTDVLPATGKVVVEGINVATCHVKPKKQGEEGGIIRREIPMYASKVMRVCPKCGKATREAFKVENGAKVRVCKKCGETI